MSDDRSDDVYVQVDDHNGGFWMREDEWLDWLASIPRGQELPRVLAVRTADPEQLTDRAALLNERLKARLAERVREHPNDHPERANEHENEHPEHPA